MLQDVEVKQEVVINCCQNRSRCGIGTEGVGDVSETIGDQLG
jgi:hypothetical protein